MKFNAVAPLLLTETTSVTSIDWSPITNAITNTITVESVIGVVAIGVGAAVTFVFAWWGARKLKNMIMSAFENGSISF